MLHSRPLLLDKLWAWFHTCFDMADLTQALTLLRQNSQKKATDASPTLSTSPPRCDTAEKDKILPISSQERQIKYSSIIIYICIYIYINFYTTEPSLTVSGSQWRIWRLWCMLVGSNWICWRQPLWIGLLGITECQLVSVAVVFYVVFNL